MKEKFDLKEIADSKWFGYVVAIGMAVGAFNKYWEKREDDRQKKLMWDDYKERHPEEKTNNKDEKQ